MRRTPSMPQNMGSWLALPILVHPPAVLRLAFGLMICLPSSGATDATYTAEGKYTHEVLQVSPVAPPARTNTGTFEVAVDNCRWFITLHPDPVMTDSGAPYVVKNHPTLVLVVVLGVSSNT